MNKETKLILENQKAIMNALGNLFSRSNSHMLEKQWNKVDEVLKEPKENNRDKKIESALKKTQEERSAKQ